MLSFITPSKLENHKTTVATPTRMRGYVQGSIAPLVVRVQLIRRGAIMPSQDPTLRTFTDVPNPKRTLANAWRSNLGDWVHWKPGSSHNGCNETPCTAAMLKHMIKRYKY